MVDGIALTPGGRPSRVRAAVTSSYDCNLPLYDSRETAPHTVGCMRYDRSRK